MKVKIDKWGHEISDDVVQDFEVRHGIRLPETYRSFLLENNVCVTEPRGFFTRHVDTIASEDKPDDELGLLRGFSNEREEWNLDWLYSIYVSPGRIAKEFLPIALDGAGNVICLGLSETKSGKIYFWFHEEETNDPFLLADSLESFLNSFGEL